MSHEVVSLIVLAIVFLVATVRGVNMGALALVASFVVGLAVYGASTKEILDGFPASLFVILVGVTHLFALAKNNGTVDWIVHGSVRAVGGRVALVPWAMFAVCATVTAIGAVSPAAVAIVAPVAMGFALRYRIHPLLMGMMVVQGATAGSFSPIGIFGSITNGVVASNQLPGNPLFLFVAALAVCFGIALLVFFVFGGRALLARGRETDDLATLDADTEAGLAPLHAETRTEPHSKVEAERSMTATTALPDTHRLNPERSMTIVGMVCLIIGALVFDLDVGFTALTVAVALTLLFPKSAKGAVENISWGTVLLIGGIVTYVGLLENQGVVDWLGETVANVGSPLVAALLICFIGAVVSAFASTTGIIGALIPLAVPFLLRGEVSAVGLITALAISSSVVDCSPFSTNGALVVANSDASERDMVFRQLMIWGMSMIVVAPLVTWAILILPTT